jgi:hypothetical protein
VQVPPFDVLVDYAEVGPAGAGANELNDVAVPDPATEQVHVLLQNMDTSQQ